MCWTPAVSSVYRSIVPQGTAVTQARQSRAPSASGQALERVVEGFESVVKGLWFRVEGSPSYGCQLQTSAIVELHRCDMCHVSTRTAADLETHQDAAEDHSAQGKKIVAEQGTQHAAVPRAYGSHPDPEARTARPLSLNFVKPQTPNPKP